MFTIITEKSERTVKNAQEAIKAARNSIAAGRRLVMIETPQGFLVTADELEDYEARTEQKLAEVR